jgi:hypothetical protein
MSSVAHGSGRECHTSCSRPRLDLSSMSGFRRNEWPIIIGGCHRSGTTLLRRMLNAHSRIYCGPEVKFFRDFYGDYPNDPLRHGRFFASAQSILQQDELLDVFGQAFVVLHERATFDAGKARWADKCPENVVYLSEWGKLLGDQWVFVHGVRNPLDTLASQEEIGFPLILPPDIEGKIALYRAYTQAGVDFAAMYPDRYYRVIYEELVSAPTLVLTEFMAWLGERFEPAQLQFNNQPGPRGLEDPNIDLTDRVHQDSVGRWSRVLNRPDASLIQSSLGELWRSIDPGDRASAAHWY